MKNIKNTEKQTIIRYSQRYKELGYDVKTLGWGSIEQQEYRFLQTIKSDINFTNKSILDIGCGFGDYFDFLQKNSIEINNYNGYDINKDLIDEAKTRYQSDISKFSIENILNTDKDSIADIGVMFGVLNFNLKESGVDNLEYSKKAIENAFNLVDEVLIVDFLSTKLTSKYPKEDFVYYHSPLDILEFAFTLSSNVVLKHNYAPIPQKEFMIYIYKD